MTAPTINRAALVAAMQATAVTSNLRSISVPGWGTVYVRKLSVADVDDQSAARRDLQPEAPGAADGAAEVAEKADNYRLARGAIYLICDEQGQRIFDPRSQEDLDLVASQPWELLRRVMELADAVNATAPAAVKNG